MTKLPIVKGKWVTARKEYPCDSYFYKTCIGTGKIQKGKLHWQPGDDCKDPFHPFRVCQLCACGYAKTEGEKS